MSGERLYGLPGAEHMHDDLAAAYEAEIEPWHDGQPRAIEEWTTYPPADHLPTVETIAVWISEWVSENAELSDHDAWSDYDSAARSQSVAVALDLTRRLIADQVGWRQADELVATHTVTWADGEPMVNGEPMYRPAVNDQ